MSDPALVNLLRENETLRNENAELRLQVHELAQVLKTYTECVESWQTKNQ